MSVLACDRKGCESIMCDYYGHTHGYICGDCITEYVNSPIETVAEFMETEKNKVDSSCKEDIFEVFEYR